MKRIRNRRNGSYTVLIVCEGKNTEPAFFETFEKYLNKEYYNNYPNGIMFTIFPYGSEKLKQIDQSDELFTRRKGNKSVYNPESIISDEIEEKYKAAPTRWVRYAQIKSTGAGFDKIWSVFDYDNRDKHLKEAFDLAKNTAVQIAYSSYSFEYWLLLHYELFMNFLPNCECKDSNGEPVGCGISNSQDVCNGNKCLIGYFYAKGYPIASILKEKTSTFPYVQNRINRAYFHATYINSLPENTGKEIWKRKPVTTAHKIYSDLMPDIPDVEWQHNNSFILLLGFKLGWVKNNNHVRFFLDYDFNSSIIVAKDSISILDADFRVKAVNERILMSKIGSYNVPVVNYDNEKHTIRFVSIELNNKIYLSNF